MKKGSCLVKQFINTVFILSPQYRLISISFCEINLLKNVGKIILKMSSSTEISTADSVLPQACVAHTEDSQSS